MRLAAIRALEIRDEAAIIHGMTRGELEAQVFEGERAQASGPPDVSGQLRLTARAEADAWQQSADAAIRHDRAKAANAATLAGQLAAERQQLEVDNACYEQWSAATATTRGTAAEAQAELKRRSLTASAQEVDSRLMPDHPAVRIGEMFSRASKAAGRIPAERQTRSEYSARIKREFKAQLELNLETQAQPDAEIEL
jgi:hypothetical protein